MEKYIKKKKIVIELGSGNGCIKKILNKKKILLTDIIQYPWINKKVDMMKVNLGNKYINKVDVFIINHSLIIVQIHIYAFKKCKYLKNDG